MIDALVKQAIIELQDLVLCRCHPAYKDRNLHDPDCHCEDADNVALVAARFEELEVKNYNLMDLSYVEHKRAMTAEAKLAKAVGALEKLARLGNGDHYGNSDGNMIACITLAELKGQDDE